MKLNRIIIVMLFVICSLFVAGILGYMDYISYNQKNLVIKMQSSRLAFSQVFFDVGHGYNEPDSYTILLQNEDLYKYVFPLTSKTIKSLRFDPVNWPALVYIKEARVENNQGDVIKKFSLKDFRPIQQISKIEISDGALILKTTENANDPILEIENSSIKNQGSWKDYMAKRGGIIIWYGLLSLLILIGLYCFIIFMARNEYIISKAWLLSIVFSLLVVTRWWYYIDAYSVNILFWDQWNWYEAFFDNKNLWELFHMQYGPHRMGVGLIISKVIATLSGWNTRVEDFAIGGIMCVAMVTALFLRYKLGPRLTWTDAAIPLIFLTPIQFELFAGTLNMSLAAVPLLMLMFYCLVWTVWRGLARYIVILVLNILLIYTGYGMFVGMITPCLFGEEALRAHRSHDRKGLWLALSGVAISLISAGSFFVGYQFSPGIEGFQFPIREWWQYPQFMALMLANFGGIKGVTVLSYITGFFLIFLMSVLAIVHAVRALRSTAAASESSVDAIIAVLTAFTLIFCANTAIGRAPLGLQNAQASRYITNMIPGFFGIYLWLTTLPLGLVRRTLLIVAVAGLIAASFPLREADLKELQWCSARKIRWKAVYLQTEDIDSATRAANFPIYPAPEQTHLKQKLNYLKREKLNLYLDVPAPGFPRQSGVTMPQFNQDRLRKNN